MTTIDPAITRASGRRRWAGAALLMVLTASLGIAGCSTTTDPPDASDGSGRSTADASLGGDQGTGSADSTDPGVPSAEVPMPEPSLDPPQDPVAAAAWVALMDPEGEYAAAASYQAVIDRYGPVEPYVSIHAAELRHVQALTRQLERLGVSVPQNPWTDQVSAPADLPTAAQAWADGEVANIALYDALMADSAQDSRLQRVFANLRRASQEEHLPMFRAAAAGDGTLTAEQMATFEPGR
ncbi:MAG: ferritin-like domain-containing protein [Actinomycetales bacterium]